MAKYLIAITSQQRAPEVRRLLGRADWTAARTHGPWTVFFHTDAAGDHLDDRLSLFKGWYLDHERGELVFGD
ncbi:MAG TPA: hypothetical protein VFN28_10430, partial [Amaricoccus sp.]|nr:hypothetical protein [Amaricoccus sp.]